MPETLAEFIRQKLDEIESHHDYAVATDTVRCWVDQFNELKKQNIPAVIKSTCDCLFPDYIKEGNKMVCGNCRLPKKQQTVL